MVESEVRSHPWKSLWALDPHIIFLNHGSFGACPIAILEKQNQFRQQLEAEPLRFFEDAYEPLIDAARDELAAFVGANSADLAFVPNATTGVNTVLRSLCSSSHPRPLQPGDELLTTDHEYNASRNALNFAAQQSGATVVVADIPFPLESPEQIISAVLNHVTDRTRLVLLDHVSSQTALVMPLHPIIQALNARGIETLIDGAHAPGMIPLELQALGATYYTGNCHKWLCAPKGSAFLYVQADQQETVRPLVISHGANSPRRDRTLFQLEFDWMGTGDPTPYLCVPEAIRYLGSLLPGGWAALMAHNRSLALAGRQILSQALKILPPCPDELIGSMATLPLPENSSSELGRTLFQKFQIEVPIIPWHQSPYHLTRISAQLYNHLEDYNALAEALASLLPPSESSPCGG